MHLSNTSDLLIVGCDGEMSSPDLHDGGRLIQAGFAAIDDTGTTQVFSELISWPDMTWSDRASAVHRLAREDVDAAAPAHEVDVTAANWLTSMGATPQRRHVLTCGFNVAGFDHPFFAHALPDTYRLLSRRTIDLNAICFTLDGWDPNPLNDPRDWAGWKKSAVAHAKEALTAHGVTGREHDAGYDAAIALHAFIWLRTQVHTARRGRVNRRFPLGVPVDAEAILGTNLLDRLSSALDATDLTALAGAFVAAGIEPRTWLEQHQPALDGQLGIDAALADADRVIAHLVRTLLAA